MNFKGLSNNTRYIKRLELCFLIQILIVFGGKGMHTYTSGSWGMEVDDLRLMLNRKWTEIYKGVLFSQNHSLNLHVVAIYWTISACTVNNISIISFIKKKTLLDDQEKHILV